MTRPSGKPQQAPTRIRRERSKCAKCRDVKKWSPAAGARAVVGEGALLSQPRLSSEGQDEATESNLESGTQPANQSSNEAQGGNGNLPELQATECAWEGPASTCGKANHSEVSVLRGGKSDSVGDELRALINEGANGCENECCRNKLETLYAVLEDFADVE